MSVNFVVEAEVRGASGTSDSRRLRHAGKVPCVMYGGGDDNINLVVDHNKLLHQLEVEAFHSAILKIKTKDGEQKAILRDVHMHPYKPQIMHVDFQRVSSKVKLTMSVPLHFKGDNSSPGVKDEGGIMTHLMNEVEITCFPADLPEFIYVDISHLHMGESFHLSEIQLPEGVELAHAIQEGEDDPSVASVLAPKIQTAETEETEEDAETEEGAEEAADDDSQDADDAGSDE